MRLPIHVVLLLLRIVVVLTLARTNLYVEHLPMKTYTSADGLGSSFVNSIMRHSRGFL